MSEIENSLLIFNFWEIYRKAILNTDTDFQTLEEIEVQKGDVEDDFDQGQDLGSEPDAPCEDYLEFMYHVSGKPVHYRTIYNERLLFPCLGNE